MLVTAIDSSDAGPRSPSRRPWRSRWRDSITAEVVRRLSVLVTLLLLGAGGIAMSILLRSPNTTLSGVVSGPGGRVAGAVVTVGGDPDRKAAVTDGSGRYHFDYLDPGPIQLGIFAPGLVCDAGRRLALRGGANSYDAALAAEPVGVGPSIGAAPVGRLTSAAGLWRLELRVRVSRASGGLALGEVLAFNGAQHRAVILQPQAAESYVAQLEAGRVGDLTGAWSVQAADSWCRDAAVFPTVAVEAPPPGRSASVPRRANEKELPEPSNAACGAWYRFFPENRNHMTAKEANERGI